MPIIRSNIEVQLPSITLVGDVEHLPESNSLHLITEDGVETLTIYTGAESPVSADSGLVHIKDYSEHSGLPDALSDAGLVQLVGKYHVGPFRSPVYIAEVL